MYKIIVIGFLFLALLGLQIFNSAKNVIEKTQEKREAIYAELGIY